jgi:hypothetical protein
VLSLSQCELEWGKEEKGGDGVRSARRRASDGAQIKRNEGSGTGTRMGIESQQGCQKGGAHCAKGRGECGTTPWPRKSGHKWAPPLTAFAGHAATVTRRA